ncbi:MAG: TIGR04282 family arsenosugar biosynthesis glycosyltransferase [Proteobacteria bacterium]|nr:TIGR04282 family arsenosugar biosynthesis glycosyltransferase [Pseudomonadota bacterium]
MGTRQGPLAQAVTVYLFAREPRPGEVKTRLVPPLDHEQAARCHKAFVDDSLGLLVAAREAGRGDASRPLNLVLAVADRDDCSWLAGRARRHGFGLVGQGRGSLGDRMQRVLALSAGAPAILMGSDSPDLPLALLEQAAGHLREGSGDRVVIGPAQDGGYYLIACRGSVPPVFRLSVPWGGTDVFEQTVNRLQAAAIRYSVLPPWSDVDDFAALGALAQRLARAPAGHAALPATRRLLAELADEGLPL